MAGRPKIFDEESVIRKATEVFWEKGYEAASTDELLAAMGIGKGSFYLAFQGGKKELYEKSLLQFAEQYFSDFEAALAKSGDPLAMLKQFFLCLADDPRNRQRGCYLGNALVQLSEAEGDIRQTAARLLTRMEGIFTATVRKARATGLLNTREKPEVLGRFLVNLWNGLNVTRRMQISPKALKELIELNLKVLT